MKSIEVLFTPAEFAAFSQRDLSRTTAIVFDVLRATSTMVTALANGAEAIIPVASIGEAIQKTVNDKRLLLAGERDGLRIRAAQTGSVDFDLGNSPREFTQEAVAGRSIVMTTSNGTRALRACTGAREVFAASFLNLGATASRLVRLELQPLVIVCSGTGEDAAFEDALGAGALCEILSGAPAFLRLHDSAAIAVEMFRAHRHDLPAAMRYSRNGRRLLEMPELASDVTFCLQRDTSSVVARMVEGVIRSEVLH